MSVAILGDFAIHHHPPLHTTHHTIGDDDDDDLTPPHLPLLSSTHHCHRRRHRCPHSLSMREFGLEFCSSSRCSMEGEDDFVLVAYVYVQFLHVAVGGGRG